MIKIDKKKAFLFGFIAFLSIITLLIVWGLYSNIKKDRNEDQVTQSAPVIIENEGSMTVEDMMKNKQEESISKQAEDDDSQSSFESFMMQDAQKPQPVYESEVSHTKPSSYEKTDYNPYADRDMYMIPQKSQRKRSKEVYDDDDYQEVETKPRKRKEAPSLNSSSNSKFVKMGDTYIRRDLLDQNEETSSKSGGSDRGEIREVYKAAITSSRNKYVTPQNNRVLIRVMESFTVKGYEIPRTTQLVAYADFGNTLQLTIKSIFVNKKVIPVSISVLDSRGQDAIEIIGGSGEQMSKEMQESALDGARTGNTYIDKAVGLVTGASKGKVKAIVPNDIVYLKINDR